MPTQYQSATLEKIIESRVFGPIDDLTSLSSTNISSMLQMTQLIDKGIPGSCVERLGKNIPPEVLSATIGITNHKLSKITNTRLNKLQTDRVNDLTILWSDLRIFFKGDGELLEQWMCTPSPALDTLKPLDLIDTIVGRQIIREQILFMRCGEFS